MINTIRTILTNPLYVGLIRYNVRRDWSEKRRNNINPDPVIQEGKHSPIISKETWEKVQAIFKTRTGKPNRVHSGEHPLTGIMKCPKCGASMVLGRTTNRNKDGTKRVLEYYVCGAWKNQGTAVCNSNSVRVDYADEYVLNKLNNLSGSEKLLRDILGKVNDRSDNKIKPLKNEYESLRKLLSGLQRKRDKVLEMYEDELIEKSDLKKRLGSLNEEKRLLEDRLSPIENMVESGTI